MQLNLTKIILFQFYKLQLIEIGYKDKHKKLILLNILVFFYYMGAT